MTTPPQTTTPVRRFNWRWLFQFRLRTLLILTTIIAVLLGCWSYKARQQREAVDALTKGGWMVEYDFQGRGLKQPPYCPVCLVNALGVDYFASVRGFHLYDALVTDADLERLASLTALRGIYLTRSRVTDARLAHLKGLTALQNLDLIGTQVSDDGLQHLKGLHALEILDVRGTQVTDAGVDRLQKALPTCKIER